MLGLLEARESGKVRIEVGDVGVRFIVLRNDRGGVIPMPDRLWRYRLGVCGDDFLSGAGDGGGGVLYTNPNPRPALGSRVGVEFL